MVGRSTGSSSSGGGRSGGRGCGSGNTDMFQWNLVSPSAGFLLSHGYLSTFYNIFSIFVLGFRDQVGGIVRSDNESLGIACSHQSAKNILTRCRSKSCRDEECARVAELRGS